MIELETLPKGWTIANFNECCENISLNGIKIKQKQYLVSGKLPVIDQGRELIGGYFNDELLAVPNEPPYIVFGDHTKVKKFVTFKFIAGADGVKVLKPFDFILQKLFFYFIHAVKMPDKGYARHYQFLASEKFPIPPFNEQKRILAKLEQLLTELDKGIEYLETTKQQLKVYRQAVLKWAFEGKLTNKDVKDGELPKGWTKTTLGEIVRKVSIKALPTEMPESKFIGMDCIESNALKPFMTYQFNQFKSAGNSFKVNHVLYGRMRPYLNKVYKAEFDGVCSGEFIIMECLNDFNPELLKYILHQRDFVRFANQKTSGDRPRVSFEELAEYPIFKCSPVEQNLIVQEIESRLSVCDKIEETIESSLQQAEALRLSIIKKAFEGKLVPQDPNDEPAEKLLERIRAEKGNGKPKKKEKAKAEKKVKTKSKPIKEKV